MKCLKCGNEIEENSKVCSFCGSIIDANNGLDSATQVENENANTQDIVDSHESIPEENPVVNQNVITQDVENNSEVINDNFTNNRKPKKKIVPVIVALVSVVLLIVLSIVLYLFVFNNRSSKSIFVDSVKSVSSKLLSNDTKKQSIESEVSMSVQGSSLGLDKIIDIVNNLDIKTKFDYDLSTNKIDSKIGINYEDKKALDIEMYGRDNELYIALGDYSKYIRIPLDDYIKIANEIDMDILNEAFIKALNDSLDEDYFTKSDKTIKVDGKDKKVKVITLSIDKKNIKKIGNSFIESLSNNDKFLSSMAKSLDTDKDSIKEELKTINFDNIDFNGIEISVYTTGIKNELVGLGIKIKDDDNNISLDFNKIDKNNYEIVVGSGVTKLTAKINMSGNNRNKKVVATMDLGVASIEVKTSSKISKIASFKDIDTTNYIDIDNFEMDQELQSKMAGNETLVKLIEDIVSALYSTDGIDINGMDPTVLF